jgi:hypothetical protein
MLCSLLPASDLATRAVLHPGGPEFWPCICRPRHASEEAFWCLYPFGDLFADLVSWAKAQYMTAPAGQQQRAPCPAGKITPLPDAQGVCHTPATPRGRRPTCRSGGGARDRAFLHPGRRHQVRREGQEVPRRRGGRWLLGHPPCASQGVRARRQPRRPSSTQGARLRRMRTVPASGASSGALYQGTSGRRAAVFRPLDSPVLQCSRQLTPSVRAA